MDDGDETGSVRLVGTAHVSAESVREVREAIAEDRPDVVAVELDEGRYRQLRGETPEDIEAGDLLRGNTVFQFLAYWMLSYVQTRLGERFDIEPGADMLAAVEAAEEHGAEVALVDRDIQTTMRRFWRRMGVLEKCRLVGALAFGAADGRVVGVTLGLLVGLIAGPLVGLFGGAVGVTEPVLVRATAAVLGGVAVGLVARELLATARDPDVALAAAGALGLGAGVVVAATGALDGLVRSIVPSTLVGVLGSLTLGLAGGLAVGGVAGLVLHALGWGEVDEEAVEEFDVGDLTDTDVVTAMMDEFRQFSPAGARALIDERDAYIAHELHDLRSAGERVVAVVGAGHREGIERYLDDPASLPDRSSLTGTATGRVPWGKVLGAGVSLALVAFFVLIALAGVRQAFLLKLFGAWFLINAVFATGLARLAGARWSAALAGGAVAWLTSVNPLLAPGWFAGYVELRHTPVNVGDVATLNDLLADETRPIRAIVDDMFDVPLFRLIMVVAMTNVGSFVASLLFAAYVLPVLAADLGGVGGVTDLMLEGASESARWIWRTVA